VNAIGALRDTARGLAAPFNGFTHTEKSTYSDADIVGATGWSPS